MKKITVLFLCLITVTAVMAQAGRISISGKVIDAEDKSPIAQATVQMLSLPDSTFVTGEASTNQGIFKFPNLKAGKYVLKISFVGYQTLMKQVNATGAKPSINLGELSLAPDAIMLGEAVIVAEAPPVTVVQDTTVYNTSAYRVPEGAMLEDLVKKLPGAEVDSEGKVTVNGKEIKKIMVDGKEFFSDDPKLAMKNLPVEMIEKVKTYDKKSDLARVTGIDDGEEEAVLDLTVKKGMKQGWFGNFIGGYGNKERYEAGAMANRFTDKAQVSILGSANNTNNQGFSEFGDAGQGLGGNAGSGINTSQSAGMNFARSSEKFEVGGDVQYGHSNRDARTKSSTETFLQNGSSYKNSLNTSNRNRHDVSGNLRMEWRPDSMTNIIFRPSASYSKTDNNSNGISTTLDNLLDSVNHKQSDNFGRNNNLSAKGNLQINRKLKGKKGRNLTLRLNYNYSNSNSDRWAYSETNFYKYDSISVLDRFNDGENHSNSYKIQMTYTEPVFTNRFLQFSYSYQYKKSHSQKYVYNANGENYYPTEERLDSLSNESKNSYMTQQLQVSLRTIREKYMYNVGISVEPQKSTTTTLLGPNAKGPLSQKVWNYSPTVDFRYRFSKQEQLRLMYRGRSSAPNIEDLQAVKDVTDPMNLIYGNPSLKPSYSNRFMMFYNKYSSKTQRGMMANLSFNNTLNSTANKITYNEETGGKITNLVNVNGNWNTQAFFSFNTPFKNRKFTFNTYTNANYQNLVGYSSINKSDSEKSTTRNLNLFEKLTGNFRSDLFEFGLSGSIRYGFSHNTIQKENNQETFDYEITANTNINLPWDIYLSSDINYSIKSGYGEGFDKNVILWNAQISKNFLKNKQATLRFKIYDILQQKSNLVRTVTANYTQDSEYNTLNSYFMVHFVYRLNTLGGNQMKGRKGRPGGPPPGAGRFHARPMM